MKSRKLISAMVVTTLMLGFVAGASRQAAAASKGQLAMDAAAKNGKYLFIYFWKQNDAQSQSMNGVLQTAMKKWSKAADTLAIQINDANEKAIVDKYDLSRAPMPLVLALAPNGAVTGGFPLKCTEKELQEAFVSPCSAKCLKCLQSQKMVLVCIQNEKTQYGKDALKGAQEFKADAKFAKAAEIVMLNPEDKEEASLLKDMAVDPKTTQAVTVILAPPGQSLGQFAGAVTKAQIVAKITAAQSGCCPGGKCGPGGCGPGH